MKESMILTSNSNITFLTRCFVLSVLFLFSFSSANAQTSLTLSVTPTLFEMAANPGQVWQSQVKVINSNSYPITVYPRVVNFAPQGESGQGKFLPVFEKMTEGTTLAEWIDIDSAPVTIEPEKSMPIPFFVNVPEGASPGGHFAAILVSTQPPEKTEGLAVKTSQIVTSLFFVRVAGNVIESGSVRTFTTVDSFVPKPNVTFELRFENKGNVHLQPQGEIRIFNMWGKERGLIPINERTHFGNVLPDSIRKFNFTWKGEQSIHDIGRYKAVAALAYGYGDKKFVTSTTHFWVVPVKSLIITISSIALIALLSIWAIRMYVRRMLQLAGVQVDSPKKDRLVVMQEGDVAIGSYKNISAPVRSGIGDLKERLRDVSAVIDWVKVFGVFVYNYKKFFVGLFAVVTALILLISFVLAVSKDGRDYEVTINNPDAELNLSAEEVAYDEIAHKRGLPMLDDTSNNTFDFIVINVSGKAGLAGVTGAAFVQEEWYPTEILAEESRQDEKTKIVFDIALQEEALEISKLLGGALLSARPDSENIEEPNITVYVGKDQITQK